MSNPNHLIHEKSPYLLQHAYNPVDWYPWGEEAFNKAEEEDKPIFLSIGYSTCHWCHVMEQECFTDKQVADLMNNAFVNIKVDREERPDIDGIYMAVSQMLTGRGGWPLSIIMTPDKKPFYSETYIPRISSYNRVGMLDLVPRIKDYWINQRERLENIAENVATNLNQEIHTTETLSETVFDTAYALLEDSYDEEWGGFGLSPKFPTPHNIMFLLRYWKRTRKEKALRMAEKTLTMMHLGGIYDHIGYGFHRYSTDREWLVPHFEKMLYDQALLIMAYTEAYQVTRKPEYRRIAEEVITYTLRDLNSPLGGFYSAEDADSNGEEGLFYLWNTDELEITLNNKEYEKIIQKYNIKPEGNYTEETTARKTGKNILYLEEKTHENETLTNAKNKLYYAREKRNRPLLDDKILTDWNGLMIAALCKASRAFQNNEYIDAAIKATEFILKEMWNDIILLHRYRENEAAIDGFLNDYTNLSWGLIELYQATGDEKYLKTCIKLTDTMLDKFKDSDGGLYFTPKDSEKLLTRRKEYYDGAIPSGNSVGFYNLNRLSQLIGEMKYRNEAWKIAESLSSRLLGQPNAYTMFLIGLDFAFGPSSEVILTGTPNETNYFKEKLSEEYLPNTIIHVWNQNLAEEIPYIADIKPSEEAEIFVCKNFICNIPTTSIVKGIEIIKSKMD